MKRIILATVLTLVMLSPAAAWDVSGPVGTLLVASSRNGPGKPGSGPGKGGPSVLIIKGEGGKVLGIEKSGGGKKKKSRK